MRRSRSLIIALTLITTFVFFNSASAQNVTIPVYNSTTANETINSTINYVNTINMSGYLIFSPNLTQAYSYLNKSISIEKTSPTSAVAYANLASKSAYYAYQQIESYRQVSLGGATLFTLAIALILRSQMKPVKPAKKGSRKTKKA
jgi:hypothetical protein